MATTWAHAVYSKESYAPFGETYNESGTPDRSFTGQEQDTVTGNLGTGTYDFPARSYDPAAGRWLSPDPSGWAASSPAYPQSLNRYAYVQNDPLSFRDPSGLACVYYGNNVSVDNTSGASGASGVCQSQGGIYVDGYTDTGLMAIDPSTTNILIVSVIESGGTSFEATEATSSLVGYSITDPDGNTVSSCSGSCVLGQSSITLARLDSLLAPTGGETQVPNFFKWMLNQTSDPHSGQTPLESSMGATSTIWKALSQTNYGGPGGNGAPTGPNDWVFATHDYQYAIGGFTWPNQPKDGSAMLQRINQAMCDNLTGLAAFGARLIFQGPYGCQ